jgi:hypothetical protein
MYFIARNNAIYSYIAHTGLRRCYLATLVAVCAIFVIGIYGIYYPLTSHIILLQSEHAKIQKQCDEMEQCDKTGQELLASIESGKKNIADRAIDSHMKDEHCHKFILSILETVTQLGLTLNAYGSCKEKDKEWYVKDVAHFDISGSMQKLMMFLEAIKKSSSMLTISQVAITHSSDDIFQMSFNVGFITIKK